MASPQSTARGPSRHCLQASKTQNRTENPLQKRSAEGLVFPLKAGNKPSKDG
jgi:hypothetical protein